MEFRLFTFVQHGSGLKSALISQEEIDDMIPDATAKDIGEYFIGGHTKDWEDHGTVEVVGDNTHMMDGVMVSN